MAPAPAPPKHRREVPPEVRAPVRPGYPLTRRRLQVALGVLWLLDAVLQFQPFMFRPSFAEQVIRPAGDGQPVWVSGPVGWSADLIAAHPVLLNSGFATVQLLLGIGLLVRRTARPALVASIAWSVGVWWLGEGLGGLASGHASLITGAPGAVLLYAVLAVLAWPDQRGDVDVPPPAAAVPVWSATWLLGALLQLLPGQNSAADVSGAFADAAADAPRWLARPGRRVAELVDHHVASYVLIVALMLAIAAAALVAGAPRRLSVVAGGVLALVFWTLGQALGELGTGQATDPNSGPLLVLLGVTTASVPLASPRPVAVGRHHAR